MASFARILQALGCFDSASGPKGGPPPEQEQWDIHAVQSFVWKIAGILLRLTLYVSSHFYGLVFLLVTNRPNLTFRTWREHSTFIHGTSKCKWYTLGCLSFQSRTGRSFLHPNIEKVTFKGSLRSIRDKVAGMKHSWRFLTQNAGVDLACDNTMNGRALYGAYYWPKRYVGTSTHSSFT